MQKRTRPTVQTLPPPRSACEMTAYDLAERVDTMRRLQRAYEQTRGTDVLATRRRQETVVDSLLREILLGGRQERPAPSFSDLLGDDQ